MLRIHLFGPLRAFVDGAPLKLTAPPKTVPLWAYLLLRRDTAISRDALAYALWPDAPESGARANLRRHLHQLRRALPETSPHCPWLLVDADTVRWNPNADYWLDVAEFERWSQVAERRAEAVALYTGDLLEDVYEDWVFHERERLAGLHAAALHGLIAQCRAQRDFAQALRHAGQLLRRDPLREDVVRQLLTLHYEAGDRAGAIQEYERFAARLRAELRVEPMPETTALYEAIVRNARVPGGVPLPEAAAPAPGEESRPLALPLTGREAEMRRLTADWSRAAQGRGGLILVGGEAGIGKTRLAAEAALRVEAQGGRVLYGGTTFAEPRPYQAIVEALHSALPLVAALDVDPVWLSALTPLLPGLGPRRPNLPPLAPLDPDRERARLFEALARCLAALSRPRPLLLILEDLHWAGAATVDLLEFLARRIAADPLLVLVTYREEETFRTHPLRRWRRERTVPVQAMPLDRLPAPAVEQMLDRVLAGKGVTPELLHALQSRGEGNPLFLGELVREVLEAGGGGARLAHLPLPGGVRTAIAGRIARLPPEARSLAEVAAVIGPAFDVELLREAAGWGEAQTLDHLNGLLDRQLVREAAGRGRYDHAFAHSLIQETIYQDVPPAARKRRHRRVAQVMEELYAARLDDLAADLARHFDRGEEPGRAAHYYLRAARHALGVHALEEALSLSRRGLELAGDPRHRFDLLALRETIHGRRGELEAHAAALRELEALAEALGEEDAICEVLLRRILFQRLIGERQAEAELISAFRVRATASGHERWRAEALQAEASHRISLGQYEAGEELLRQALSLHRASGDVDGQVAGYCLQADIAIQRWRLDDLQTFLDRANALLAAHPNHAVLVRTLRSATAAAFARQDYPASLELAQRLLERCLTLGDLEGEADARDLMAKSLSRLFRVSEAREHFARAAQLYRALGKRQGQAAVLLNGGMLLVRLGRYAEGIDAFRQAEALFEALQDLRGQTLSALNLSAAAIYRRDWDLARQAAQRGLELARGIGLRVAEVSALGNLGEIASHRGEFDLAVETLRSALALRVELAMPAPDAGSDMAVLIETHLRRGDLAQARRLTGELLDLHDSSAESMAHPQHALWASAQTHHALGDEARATGLAARAYAIVQARAAAIPDPESRNTFLELPFNREILAAHRDGVWPL